MDDKLSLTELPRLPLYGSPLPSGLLGNAWVMHEFELMVAIPSTVKLTHSLLDRNSHRCQQYHFPAS